MTFADFVKQAIGNEKVKCVYFIKLDEDNHDYPCVTTYQDFLEVANLINIKTTVFTEFRFVMEDGSEWDCKVDMNSYSFTHRIKIDYDNLPKLKITLKDFDPLGGD